MDYLPVNNKNKLFNTNYQITDLKKLIHHVNNK